MVEDKEKIINVRKESILTKRGMMFSMITTMGPLVIGLAIRQIFGDSSILQVTVLLFIISLCFFFFLMVTKKQLLGFAKLKYFKTSEINQDEYSRLKSERKK